MQDLDGSQGIAEGTEKISVPSYEQYAKGKLRQQEHRKLRIGLERLNRSLALIEGSWQRTNRRNTLYELENILKRQHEIENETEKIKDVFLRGYIHEQLDSITFVRRNLAEEVKWEIEANVEQ
ncbi:MAG: hypothetical protein MPEBLZ_04163 [Candidatus Methanoperedens nitroreducens]|uniref:Uncharacterized protein n=1 Tax=Candidatus Methanoperedens nitratireducens TaxID=1392998 RepID=A0A0P8A4A9_9EURY|nr:hypothetical protein [Candidatus Methanoperedens sp. BLZ2]KAB2942982.1 MAG: hypothetical protein F9K14_16555 [Candidatus Methanoperedens sp.]KPQ41281.1 MAG: hypothetical protein MPEBLZ_04163 [Candidatus Methanoperedens sp. BLZ1]MBZ0174020.1 hypothetical protein [Candidatus Methanoperedens nitroreducens]CAG0968426.1 hypothetical protein METP2_01243 [Methanosarcinales archaeon]MCX9079114.1 hypothetical protein [Candidatus Methanoperedens sp.]